jgi:uncharacterized membrane-anchored protein
MRLPEQHPQRRALTEEVHSRPYVPLCGATRISHLAMLSGERATEADRAHVNALCAEYALPPAGDDCRHLLLDFGRFRLKWERHTEASSYTFYAPAQAGRPPLSHAALEDVPEAWVAELPGTVLVAIRAEIEAPDAPRRSADDIAALLGTDNFAGSMVTGGGAAAWMNFAIGESGFGAALIQDRGARPRQIGRLVQRLMEIETYRMMALLALPVAQAIGPDLSRLGEELAAITEAMPAIENLEDEEHALDQLSRLSAEVERRAAQTTYRFSAARAYYRLVLRRIEELREERIEGLQTIAEFMDRRLAPAMSTCESVAGRLEQLSMRTARASELLRTRVDVHLERQNRDLLSSMNRRAKLQVRLQQTVEGLSVAAISYYLVSLVGYFAKGAKAAGIPLQVELVTALAVPLVVGAVWLGMRRVRRILERDT